MSDSKEKRMIADTGYEVKHAICIGDREILIAENMKEPNGNYYLIANYWENGIVGEYSLAMVSNDYIEIMQEYAMRITHQTKKVKAEIGTADYQTEIFAAEHCYPNDYSKSIEEKVVAIKAETLRSEYRRGDVQLVYVTGGFGAMGDARGNAVHCYHLNDGKQTRFERYQVLGEVKVLPDWAKERLAVLHKRADNERENLSSGKERKHRNRDAR
jgi:hypothetical protein